jgi:RNA polymerase sigma-54 factor
MKQSLQLQIGQQLSMTPQLQQAIRLLQLSSTELLAEIRQQLEDNPLLEQPESSDDDSELDESVDVMEDDWEAGVGVQEGSTPFEERSAAPPSLNDRLLWQLRLAHLSDVDLAIGYCLIDALDERGYLHVPLEEIADASRRLLGSACPPDSPEEDEVLAVLHRIQQLEPVGVAARSLTECLLLQATALPEATPYRNELLALLSRMEKSKDPRKFLADNADVQADVMVLLRSLDPAPGAAFNQEPEDYVIPDVVVRRHRGRWQAQLNPRLQPKICINQMYAKLARQTENASDGLYLREQLQEARWFIKSLNNRQETLLQVAETILEMQQGFFDYGEEAMRPLVLADVAERVGMHESTISRVTTQKYMHTPRGLFELKYFFSSHVATEGGGACSSTAIRAIIKKLVTAENPRRPLSDSRLTDLLNDQGIQVARRTVAKYREALNIPSSSERKRFL